MDDKLFIPGSTTREESKFLADGLIPFGGFYLVASQPGVGKSWLLEYLATCMTCGTPFLGSELDHGDVLLVDEDTIPSAKALDRLEHLFTGCGHKSGDPLPNKLFAHIGEGYRISSDGTNGIKALVDRQKYENVKLIIIESLSAVIGGKLNPDNTKDANTIVEALLELSGDNRAVVVSHHISTKKIMTVDDLMFHENPDSLLMNNTRLVSASSAYCLLASPTKGQALERLYIRPVSRRVMMSPPFIADFSFNDSSANFVRDGEVMSESERLIRSDKTILSHLKPNEEYSVKDIDEAMEGFMHIMTLRDRLKVLEETKYVLMPRRGTNGMHMYVLAPKGIKWHTQHGSEIDE